MDSEKKEDSTPTKEPEEIPEDHRTIFTEMNRLEEKNQRTFKVAVCCGSIFDGRAGVKIPDAEMHPETNEVWGKNIYTIHQYLGKRRFSTVEELHAELAAKRSSLPSGFKTFGLDRGHKVTQLESKLHSLEGELNLLKVKFALFESEHNMKIKRLEDDNIFLKSEIQRLEKHNSEMITMTKTAITNIEEAADIKVQKAMDLYRGLLEKPK